MAEKVLYLAREMDCRTMAFGGSDRLGGDGPTICSMGCALTSAAIVLAFTAAGGSASCDTATLAAADVSGDNRVTSLDALTILQGCG